MAFTVRSAGDYQIVEELTVDPSAVAAGSVSEETFTCGGLKTDMMPVCQMPSLEAGCYLIGSTVSATNTIKVFIWNTTGASVNPASQTLRVAVL